MCSHYQTLKDAELLQRLAAESCVLERDREVSEILEACGTPRKGMAPR